MPRLYSDTHPKMEALHIRLLRESPPWRKMEMLAGLNASARMLALAGLSQRYPNASDDELHRRLNTAIANLDAVLVGIRNGDGTVGKLFKDPTLYSNLNNVVPDSSPRKKK